MPEPILIEFGMEVPNIFDKYIGILYPTSFNEGYLFGAITDFQVGEAASNS